MQFDKQSGSPVFFTFCVQNAESSFEMSATLFFSVLLMPLYQETDLSIRRTVVFTQDFKKKNNASC